MDWRCHFGSGRCYSGGAQSRASADANQSLATLYHKKLITLETALSRSSNADELQDIINRGAGINVTTAPTTPAAAAAAARKASQG